jgi:acyl-CoA reductase-like NAD-dependent aldehyde dehydrogenase
MRLLKHPLMVFPVAFVILVVATVAININDVTDIRGPFGRRKASGIGRELGQPGLDSYLEVKHVRVRRRRPRG